MSADVVSRLGVVIAAPVGVGAAVLMLAGVVAGDAAAVFGGAGALAACLGVGAAAVKEVA